MIRPLICLFALVLSSAAVSQIDTLKTQIRLNYMPVQMPDEPNLAPSMGLAGLHYQLFANNWWYVQFGTYAAITGDQGGLFTLGGGTGVQFNLTKQLVFDADLHYGGGGGYRYLVNDGGYINANIGLGWQQQAWQIIPQYSYLNFHSGSIADHGLSVTLKHQLDLHHADFFAQYLPKVSQQQSLGQHAIMLRFDQYLPLDGAKHDNNHDQAPIEQTLHLFGFEYQQHLHPKFYGFVQMDAIYKGLTSGYMDVFIGGAFQQTLWRNITLEARLALGAAGGRIAPEGGATAYPSLALQLPVGERVALVPHIGWFRALDGDFAATTVGASIKYNWQSGAALLAQKKTRLQPMRISLSNQGYQQAARMRREPIDLQLTALQIDMYINDWLAVFGKSAFAHKGESGGYADGIAGISANWYPFAGQADRIALELLAGVAGGGGVDAGQGLVAGFNIALQKELYRGVAIHGALGQMAALEGEFNSLTWTLGLSKQMSFFTN